MRRRGGGWRRRCSKRRCTLRERSHHGNRLWCPRSQRQSRPSKPGMCSGCPDHRGFEVSGVERKMRHRNERRSSGSGGRRIRRGAESRRSTVGCSSCCFRRQRIVRMHSYEHELIERLRDASLVQLRGHESLPAQRFERGALDPMQSTLHTAVLVGRKTTRHTTTGINRSGGSSTGCGGCGCSSRGSRCCDIRSHGVLSRS